MIPLEILQDSSTLFGSILAIILHTMELPERIGRTFQNYTTSIVTGWRIGWLNAVWDSTLPEHCVWVAWAVKGPTNKILELVLFLESLHIL